MTSTTSFAKTGIIALSAIIKLSSCTVQISTKPSSALITQRIVSTASTVITVLLHTDKMKFAWSWSITTSRTSISLSFTTRLSGVLLITSNTTEASAYTHIIGRTTGESHTCIITSLSPAPAGIQTTSSRSTKPVLRILWRVCKPA